VLSCAKYQTNTKIRADDLAVLKPAKVNKALNWRRCQMPSSTIIHAVVFTAGAVVGGGVAAVFANTRRHEIMQSAATSGSSTLAKGTAHTSTFPISNVLKYGNPGVWLKYA
jgi:hypothetical protein